MDMVNQDFDNFVISMTRKELHELVRASSKRSFDDKLQELEETIVQITKCFHEKMPELQKLIKAFKAVYKRKWRECNSTESRFLKCNEEWLNMEVLLPTGPIALSGNSKPKGLPSKEFGELSDRTKRRKTMELRKNVSCDELTYSAQMSQRAAGNNDVAKVIQDVTKTPTRAEKFRKAAAIGRKPTTSQKHTPEEALSIYVEANLTVNQYEVIHQANKDIYPCYTYLQKAKQDCYPPKSVSETAAEVKLQDLVDHTAIRLCKYLVEVLQQCVQNTDTELTFIYKWGCDGSAQNQFKQKFEEDGNSDASVFKSSLVPLRLLNENTVVWQNMQPSSPRFCRPILIRFVKENKDITSEEIDYIENQAQHLVRTSVSENIQIKHVLLPTMVDGKVCNAATNTTSTLRCYICNKTSKQFNDLTITNTEKPETFKFGLSILHSRIRFFEFLLHLSYKLKAEVYKGRIAGNADKAKIQVAKENMQKEFKQRMGLLVDIPKTGYGNTKDGNTSRRFFSEPEEVAAITGIDLKLIKDFRIILEVLSSGFDIDIAKFEIFKMETAKYYVGLYSWQPMSPTVHKILTHSASVINHALLPIGQLSEEAAEARNKHFRQYRENFSRKSSRTDCNVDIINRLLLTSDPYLSSIRTKKSKKRQAFSEDACKFFKTEELRN